MSNGNGNNIRRKNSPSSFTSWKEKYYRERILKEQERDRERELDRIACSQKHEENTHPITAMTQHSNSTDLISTEKVTMTLGDGVQLTIQSAKVAETLMSEE